jgi:transcriptional regulator with GAF, ATPase, and Fis domain
LIGTLSWVKARTGCEGFRFSRALAFINAAMMRCTAVAESIACLFMSLTPHTNGNSESFGMVGRDPRLRRIIETIRTVAPSDASILIEGETGTGKQLIANVIHAESRRCAGPLIRANCAAIPHELSEAELFGNQQGA